MSYPATSPSPALPTSETLRTSDVSAWRAARYPLLPWRDQLGPTARGVLQRPALPGLLVYGQGRTGSTVLGSLLGSRPEVLFLDEVLRTRVWSSRRYVDGLRSRFAAQHCCIHVKPQHLTYEQGVQDRARWLAGAVDRGWRLVHLQRHNTLRHCLSGYQLAKTGVSHTRTDDAFRPQPVRVDPADLLAWIAIREQGRAAEIADLTGLPHEVVVYERDLLPGPEAWVPMAERVLGTLGLPSAPVTTPLRKTNTGPLSDLVANADELLAAVAASDWADLVAFETV